MAAVITTTADGFQLECKACSIDFGLYDDRYEAEVAAEAHDDTNH